MEQSPSANTKRHLPRRAMVALAALGMSGLLLQPDSPPNHADSLTTYVQAYASKAAQQFESMAAPSLDIRERSEPHNDRYGIREILLPQGVLPNDAFFENTTSWNQERFLG